MNKFLKNLRAKIEYHLVSETPQIALGRMLSNQQWQLQSKEINDYEFTIFSQSGDDGIIQYLIKHIEIKNKQFIEFGVEDYTVSNTRFLMMNNNWAGLVMDGSADHMKRLRKRKWFWHYDLQTKAVFIDKDNINGLIAEAGFSDIGLLHIDLDGNDYYILDNLDLSRINPSIISIEYNSLFGSERPISVPYNKLFYRTNAHYSNLFFGASLPALVLAANRKGYALVGCTIAGDNAYFVRRDLLNHTIQEQSIEKAFRSAQCRQGRTKDYKLSFLRGDAQIALLRGLTVFNVLTQKEEAF